MLRVICTTGILLAGPMAYGSETLTTIVLYERGPAHIKAGSEFRYQIGTPFTAGITRAALPPTHPLYVDEFGMDDRVLGIFDISGNGDNYYVVFSSGPSWDLNYCLYQQARVDEAITAKPQLYFKCDAVIDAPNLTITSDGWLYASGHNNNLVDEKRAYRFDDKKFVEAPQPMHYIGKASVSQRDQQLFSDEALKQPSFNLGKGEPVTVVAVKAATDYRYTLLIANQHGLTGWVLADGHQTDNQFKDIYFAGD